MRSNQELRTTPNLVVIREGIDGGCGELYRAGKPFGSVIWSNGGGWEHVSVCPFKRSYTPSWSEMCYIKDMFFYDEEVVVQYHPAKSQYVNNLPNCLHLWRPLNDSMPTPPSIMVGIRDGQTQEEILREIADVTTDYT